MATNVIQYATPDDLEAYIGTNYAMPDEPDRLLQRASEVVELASFGAVGRSWYTVDMAHPADIYINAIRDATCAQVEFWLEVGEEFDTSGLSGSLAVGRMQIAHLPLKLSLRARRHLAQVGLVSNMVGYVTG